MLCAGMSWIRSMIWACGLMPRITPFMLPTNTSAAPKSVSRVMMGGGTDSGLSGDRAMTGLTVLEADVEHFVLHDFGRGLDLDGLAHPLADEGPSDRGVARDLAVCQIAFVRTAAGTAPL